MPYKTIMIYAVFAGSVQHAWTMEQAPLEKQAREGYAALASVQAKCAQAGVLIMRNVDLPPEFSEIIPKILAVKQEALKAPLKDKPRILAPTGALAQELEAALAHYLKNKEATNNKDAT